MTTTSPTRRESRTWLLPVAADLVCVLVFAVAGKGSHEAGASAWVVLAIVWPFALAALVAHAGLALAGRPAVRVWPEGAAVLATTYVLGMVLRVASGRGIAGGFLVVALVFLLVTMLGWRLVHRVALARRARRLTRHPAPWRGGLWQASEHEHYPSQPGGRPDAARRHDRLPHRLHRRRGHRVGLGRLGRVEPGVPPRRGHVRLARRPPPRHGQGPRHPGCGPVRTKRPSTSSVRRSRARARSTPPSPRPSPRWWPR